MRDGAVRFNMIFMGSEQNSLIGEAEKFVVQSREAVNCKN